MYKINLKTFSNLSCMLSYANDVNKCDNCKEGDCTKDYLGECVFDYQVSAYKFLVLEEEYDDSYIDLDDGWYIEDGITYDEDDHIIF